MSLKKQYNKSKSVCKVTFALAKDIAVSAKQVNLSGDFNNWDVKNLPMLKSKSGEYSVTINLEKDKQYQFKYIIDNKDWVNDMEADKFVPNVFHSQNSVIFV
jgi:1,4-alpha-glucan branching enzyme